jgi:hypothetical protein
MAYRPGWWFGVLNLCAEGFRAEAMWCFGLSGAALLQISVDRHGRYLCYDHDNAGEDAAFLTIAEVEEWLARRESEVSALPALEIEIAREDDWHFLKTHAFQVNVSWSDSTYQASLPGVWEASVGATLGEAVSRAAEIICRLHEAPVNLAPQLTLRASLDEAATAQLRRKG